MNKIRILFWGTSKFAVPSLRILALWDAVNVVGVITQPDKQKDSNGDLVASPVKHTAEELKIELLQPDDIGGESFLKKIQELEPDISVVTAFGKIIPKNLIDLPKYGTLNIHPSLLPKYRGPSPIQATILAGDSETGVSLMLIDEEMDHGPILAQEKVQLDGTENYPELEQRLADIGSSLLKQHLQEYVSGNLIPTAQNHKNATFCKKIKREDGRIDWNNSSDEIEHVSRAYDPWPGIWTEWTNDKLTLRVKLFGVKIVTEDLEPGVIFKKNDHLLVGTGKGTLLFNEVQVEGKKRMKLPELLRGMAEFLDGQFR